MAPRTRQPPKKDSRSEVKKLQKRREQVKMAMRRHRQKLTEKQLEERRRKDRERYQRKKEDGQVKTINQFTPRTRRIIRNQWKERAKRYRDNKKALRRIHQQTENFIENETNFLQLIQCLEENSNGVQIIPIDEDNVITIENLLAKSLTPAFKGTLSIHQVTWNKDSPTFLHARKLSCVECRPDQICSHYEMGVINTEYNQIFTDPPSQPQSDQEISEEHGPSGLFSHTENESPARRVDTDDEDSVTVSIPTKRSRNFYFKSINGSSSEEITNEEIKKKQSIDQVFNEASDFTKSIRFNIFASDSSDEDLIF